jgi:hypothetical protein
MFMISDRRVGIRGSRCGSAEAKKRRDGLSGARLKTFDRPLEQREKGY